MMKNEKGFTLIELLTVLIVLSLIALITIPIVTKITREAKEGSASRSIDLYASAISNAISKYQMNTLGKVLSGRFDTEDGKTLTLKGDMDTKLTIDYNGNILCDKIEIYKDGKIYLADCKVNDKDVDYIYGEKQELPLTPVSFAEDEWETIIAAVKAGNLSKYKVGDTKEIKLNGFTNTESNSNGLYTVRIANTSTPEECSQEGFSQTACGFVIEFVDIITTHSMNSTNTNVGGWRASSMRTYVNDTIYNALPQELKDTIIDTKVVSSHGSSDSSNFTSTDKLYLLSTKEVWGKEGTSNTVNYDSAEAETRQLDYYKNIGVTTSKYSVAIKKYNGSTNSWWLRSASSNYASVFYLVNNFGDWGSSSAGGWYGTNAPNTKGVAAAFRIG